MKAYAAPHLIDVPNGSIGWPDDQPIFPSAPEVTRGEVKATRLDAHTASLVGYASAWGGPPDSYNDVVEKGAFARTIKATAGKRVKVPLLAGHDPQKPCGGVLELQEDTYGLLLKAVVATWTPPLAATCTAG